MQHITDGFIDPWLYLTYVLCTLITIQIWYSTTLFINRYGNNSPSDLEFMHEEQVATVPKNLYLIAAFVIYYVFLFLLVPYTKQYSGNRTDIFHMVPGVQVQQSIY